MDDELSTRLVIDFDGREPGGLDLEGLWMRNRLLERIFGEVEPMPRFGERWRLRDAAIEGPQLGLPVEDERGARGVLHFLIKPPSPAFEERLCATMNQYLRVEHEHLEPLLDVGMLDGRPWLVRPLERTRMMREWLHDEVETWTELIDKFVGVCRAVAELHRAGIVHGELVPDAFVLDSRGRARVRGALEGNANRLASRRPERANLSTDQADLCMAIHGALLAVETALVSEAPAWLVELLERGFAERAGEQWPSVDAMVTHLEHRLRMRSRLVVLRGGAAA
ncbi:hypothetical protein ACNOYE_29735 [Nannocystaceae bacterium ST9]